MQILLWIIYRCQLFEYRWHHLHHSSMLKLSNDHNIQLYNSKRHWEHAFFVIVAWGCCRLLLTRGWMNGSFREACASLLLNFVIVNCSALVSWLVYTWHRVLPPPLGALPLLPPPLEYFGPLSSFDEVRRGSASALPWQSGNDFPLSGAKLFHESLTSVGGLCQISYTY